MSGTSRGCTPCWYTMAAVRYVIAPILRDPQEREECLSEVTMRVWEKIDPFQEERGSWNGWLTSLTRHAALNHVWRISRHGGAEALSEDPPSPELTPEEVPLLQERQTALQAALGQLSAGEGFCFTENTTICPPPPRSPWSWGLQSGRWRDGYTG